MKKLKEWLGIAPPPQDHQHRWEWYANSKESGDECPCGAKVVRNIMLTRLVMPGQRLVVSVESVDHPIDLK